MVSVCAPGEDCRYGKSGGPVGHERDEPCYIYRAEPPETRAGESASVSHGPKRREQTAEQDGKSGQSFHWRDQAINRNDAKSVEWTENRCFRWRAALALGLTLLCRPASRRAQCFAGHRYQSDQVNDFVRVERKCEREKADLKCETDCRRKDPFQTDRDLAPARAKAKTDVLDGLRVFAATLAHRRISYARVLRVGENKGRRCGIRTGAAPVNPARH